MHEETLTPFKVHNVRMLPEDDLSPLDRMEELGKDKVAEFLDSKTEGQQRALLHDWRGFLARPSQLPPEDGIGSLDGEDWDIWTMMAGRGYGKTRSGAEAVKEAEEQGYRSFCLIGETLDDVRDIMILGESGLLSLYNHLPRDQRPVLNKSDKQVEWPSGAIAKFYGSYKPDAPRGNNYDMIWADELSSWMYARETWDNAVMGLRKKDAVNPRQPRIMVTTTPKPVPLMVDIIRGREGNVVVTFGSTKANMRNLSDAFIRKVFKRYEGTRTGAQELEGQLLLDMPGGLWRHEDIQEITRTDYEHVHKENVERIVVCVDPAVTTGEEADESGIYVVAASRGGHEGFVLANGSGRLTPNELCHRALSHLDQYNAEAVVVETNNGGDTLPAIFEMIRPGTPVIQVKGTKGTGGKSRRAQPIAAMYEQKRIFHVGSYPTLNSQMLLMTIEGWQGEGSPDHLDAVCWGFHHLFPEFIAAGRPDRREKRNWKKRRKLC